MKHTFRILPLFLLAGSLYGANLIPGDSSFETGFGAWEKNGTITQESSVDGEQSLKLTQKLRSNITFSLNPETPYVFSVWIKAAKPDTRVMLQAYRSNWDGRNSTTYVRAGTEWKRFQLSIPPQKLGDYNNFWMEIQPDRPGTIWLDAPQLESGKEATGYSSAEALPIFCDVAAPVPGHIFLKGEPIQTSLKLYNTKKVPAETSVFLKITDYYGVTVLNHTEKIKLSPGKSVLRNFNPGKLDRKGFYLITYGTVDADGKQNRKTASFCLLDAPEAKPADSSSIFGICGGGASDRIPAVSRMGAHAQAIAFRWSYDQKYRRFNPASQQIVDNEIEQQIRHGIEPVVYLRRTPSWAAMKQHPHDVFPPQDEFIQNYEDFARRVAERYKGKVTTFQMWGGEADLLANLVLNELGKDKDWFAQRVADLCKAGYRGVKSGNPDAIVETTAVSGVDCTHAEFKFLKKVLEKAKGYYDEVVIHPYCYPSLFDGTKYVQSPEENNLVKIYQEISRLSGGKKVTNGEFGYAISGKEAYDSPASKKMADYLARTFLLSASCPEVKRVMWYSIAPNDTYSIWDWPNPRPAVAAYSALSKLLTGAKNPEEIHLGSLIRGYCFSRKSGSVAALWCPENKEIEFKLPSVSGITLLDLMGNEIKTNGSVLLSGSPVYLVSTGKQNDLKRTIQTGTLMIQPLTLEIRAENKNRLCFYLTNQLNQELSGEIRLAVPVGGNRKQEFLLPFQRMRAGVMEKITLDIPQGIDFKELNGKSLSGTIKTQAGETAAFSQKMEFLPCPYRNDAPVIDGNLEKWRKFPSIELSTTEHLFPPDAFSHGLWKNAADLSVRAWVAWDDHNFYFAARVTDDVFRNPNPAASIWAGDCIQMAFDPRNDAIGKGYKKDEVELNIGFSEVENRTVVSRTWPLPPDFPQKIRAVVKRNGTDTIYEMAVPFQYLRNLKPQSGSVFGFNFAVLDADLKNVDYWMGLTYGICGGKDPSVFQKFILEK